MGDDNASKVSDVNDFEFELEYDMRSRSRYMARGLLDKRTE